jgi:glycosyltransferase involved in cell wall biosynthesis
MHSRFPEADGEAIHAVELEALAAADRVFYTAQALLDHERDLAGDRACFLDHGVDVDHFQRRPAAAVPDDLAAIPGPRIGFFGGLDDYLVDFDLLEALAEAMPEASVVLIGDAPSSLRRFDRLPNVHLLGYRPYADIPAYGSGFDVALMPWLDNEWIRYCNPIKMKEYLALGLPVVSTDFPEVRRYASLIRVAPDREAFIDAVRQTVQDGGLGTPETRRAAVADATWSACAHRLLVETEDAIPNQSAPGSSPSRTVGAGKVRPMARVRRVMAAMTALSGGSARA